MSGFLVTGVSTGLGRAIAVQALTAGHTVTGTLRNPDQIAEFERLAPGRAHGRLLDVADTDAVAAVIEDIETAVAPIDVLVNNAGYGVEGTFEETPLDIVRQQFEVNVFGVVAVTQAVLPRMRKRRAGQIFFITSMGGLRTFPGLSAYHGSKFAVEGIAAALRQEVAPFGIRVTAVEPGGFRTDWAGRSMSRVERSIADYDDLFAPIRRNRLQMSGAQIGDPAKAGDAILQLVDAPTPPGHLLLGSDALRLVQQAHDEHQSEIQDWSELSLSTDFPDGKALD